ncbi:hypothetical protein [Streptomyces sp. WG5]|uniref:hypothetical protein n=1 Tax=Streptomyces sp. WG5 TaxID=3417648 RepID=UPI003CEB4E37
MSARDDMDAFLACHGLSVIDRQKAQWFMADFAHELAEQIRNSEGPINGGVLGGLWMDSRDQDHAADLIDPEVAS